MVVSCPAIEVAVWDAIAKIKDKPFARSASRALQQRRGAGRRALLRRWRLVCAKTLAPYGLHWIEEPADPLDYALLAEIAAFYTPSIATGENLVHFGGMRSDRDIIQIDVPQSYGIVQFARTLMMRRSRTACCAYRAVPASSLRRRTSCMR